MRRLTRYFLEGLLFLVPVVATVYIIYVVFVRLDGLFQFEIPGVGILVTILAITLIGFIASNFVTRTVLSWVDQLMRKLPLVKLIYTSLKDLIEAFVGDKRRFNRPVAVTLAPGSSMQVLGFVTAESLDALGMKECVAVYLPQSYNFAGNLIVVPREQVRPVAADSGDVMAFIVSGGVSFRKDEKETPKEL
ncbi:MAG: DUF502 domain-containing protein [Nitrospirota bacterium]|jgi:uncharacterized membrane protein